MKNLLLALFSFIISGGTTSAQEPNAGESFGHTLNLGAGIGYYGYVGHSMPVIHADFEFEVADNFTLAPFITAYTYRNYYYWGNPNNPYRDYYYRQTVIPVGVKGSYYFDKLLSAGSKWDFYLAASLGYAIRRTTWENGYSGETTVQHGSSGIYLDGHIGTEYHLKGQLGLFLDLSTGISTFGLAIHM
ncbi:MAG: hypothetical protein FD123_4139 [Bacteroidetes bacterium]|nr:MAG: hypothetical protein FD123_4139 [Bacteroidota bacterium]